MQYLLTFAVMLVVALITAHLSAGLREQAALAAYRERRAHALYELARELAGAMTIAEVERIAVDSLRKALGVETVVLIRSADGTLSAVSGAIPAWVDMSIAADACSEATCADLASHTPTAYFPLIASKRLYGVLAVRSIDETGTVLRENAELLDIVASLVSIVIERLDRAS
jgi:two-component system sensor histidine kinase KdpD